MVEVNNSQSSSIVTANKNQDDYIFTVDFKPVMKNAFDVLTAFGKTNRVTLTAKDETIPNAVAIANIITEKFLKGNSKIEKINLDSEIPSSDSRMISTIEIIIIKL